MHEQIIEALRRGANDEALALARGFAAEAPGDAQAQRLLGVALQQAGAHDEALAAIDRAIALAPDEAELHFLRAGLLLGRRQIDEAQASLTTTVALDPNQFGAYVMQAQLALARGDLLEAGRLQRLAARLAPQHPWQLALEGMLALRQGDSSRALGVLTRASESAPDDVQVKHALGFAHLAQGNLAFAEQAFRNVLAELPHMRSLRGLLADLLRRQERYAEAAEELRELLADEAAATPGLRRFVAELELAAGRPEPAVEQFKTVLAQQPADARALRGLLLAWQATGAADDARDTLEALLATTAGSADAWQARLGLEPVGSEGARAIAQRWVEAMPDSVQALEAALLLHELAGENDQADAVAARIVELEPGRTSAELRTLDALMQRDPGAAVARIEHLVAQAPTPEAGEAQWPWLAYAYDRAGRYAEAAELWSRLNRDAAPRRLPLTEPSAVAAATFAEPMQPDDASPALALLWGAPGSGVEDVAMVIGFAGYPLLADRFGPAPPNDWLQRDATIPHLSASAAGGASLVQAWRADLPARGSRDGYAIDWIPWWDNALLGPLREHVREGRLLIAIRDPRDMLLEWMAFGAPAPFAIESPAQAASWLATQLEQAAAVHEADAYPHALLRVDHAADDVEAFAADVGGSLGLEQIAVPPAAALGSRHFPPGHWRHYRQALAAPFAALTPVAVRLGYPET